MDAKFLIGVVTRPHGVGVILSLIKHHAPKKRDTGWGRRWKQQRDGKHTGEQAQGWGEGEEDGGRQKRESSLYTS